ncbi:MAG TPA: carboxypeptidase-like regulatory domain-containing protein, partial [Chitinophagaceae bacterium]
MRRIITTLAIILGMTISVHAQTKNGKINGSIKDGSQKNILSATITLLRAGDSSSVKFSAADKNGNYEFAGISDGKYLVAVTSVGFDKAFSTPFEITETNPVINLAVITLSEAAKGLEGV